MTKLSNTAPCIINKNTPELRMFLERVGYKYSGMHSKQGGSSIYCAHGNYYIVNNRPSRGEPVVDCYGNEDMFKLVATLKMNEPLDPLTKAEILSIKKGIEDIKNRRTYKMKLDESLTKFLERIKKI